jgi:hypothetical protein
MAVARCFVSDGGGNSQFNFRTRSGFAPEFQSRADLFCTFTDSGQPPVPGASTLIQDFQIYAFSIIAGYGTGSPLSSPFVYFGGGEKRCLEGLHILG